MRENAGYKIIQSAQFDDVEIVLGHNIEDEMYVTWKHDVQKDYYYWGHYFTSYDKALKDFKIRIQNEIPF